MKNCSICRLNNKNTLARYAVTSKNVHFWSIPTPHSTENKWNYEIKMSSTDLCCLISVDACIVLAAGYPPSHTSHVCVKSLLQPPFMHSSPYCTHSSTPHPSYLVSHICKLGCGAPPPRVHQWERRKKTNPRQTTCRKADYVFHDSDLPHQPTTGTNKDLDYLSREH
jgi:hypothetical protein